MTRGYDPEDVGLDEWRDRHDDAGCRTLGDKPTGRCAGRYCERVRVVGEWYSRGDASAALLGLATSHLERIEWLNNENARLRGVIADV